MDLRQLLMRSLPRRQDTDSSFAGWVQSARGEDAYAREAQSQGMEQYDQPIGPPQPPSLSPGNTRINSAYEQIGQYDDETPEERYHQQGRRTTSGYPHSFPFDHETIFASDAETYAPSPSPREIDSLVANEYAPADSGSAWHTPNDPDSNEWQRSVRGQGQYPRAGWSTGGPARAASRFEDMTGAKPEITNPRLLAQRAQQGQLIRLLIQMLQRRGSL